MPSALGLLNAPVIRGEPNLILVRPRVSVPLISRPVVDYRIGGTTPYGVRICYNANKWHYYNYHVTFITTLLPILAVVTGKLVSGGGLYVVITMIHVS